MKQRVQVYELKSAVLYLNGHYSCHCYSAEN